MACSYFVFKTVQCFVGDVTHSENFCKQVTATVLSASPNADDQLKSIPVEFHCDDGGGVCGGKLLYAFSSADSDDPRPDRDDDRDAGGCSV